MLRISLAEIAHDIVRRHLCLGGIAVDATLGNGHDTQFLAEWVGDQGHVFGFDIQLQALTNTSQRLRRNGLENRVTLFHACHAEMLGFLPDSLLGRMQAIMFNLGYLPGADKKLITRTKSTLAAIDAAIDLLSEQGVITVLAYPGHAGGDQETRDLADRCAQLERRMQIQLEIILGDHHQPKSPRLFVIRKPAYLL